MPNWWAPIWTGLVMDREAKHYRAMGNALWLYLYFILNAERKRGFLVRKIKTIESDTGIKQRTIRLWIKILKDKGYIRTQSTGRSLFIQIKLWKSLYGRQDHASQSNIPLPTRVAKSCHFKTYSEGINSFNVSQKSANTFESNDITIKKYILKNDIDSKNLLRFNRSGFKGFKPKTKEERLAVDIAETLNDYQGLLLYLAYAKKYPETLLRRVLGIVLEVPMEKIKKSRGALFNYLIQQYDDKKHKNVSH